MIRPAVRPEWLVLLLLPTLLAPACVVAIYEDQAGTFDWYKQYVGRPTSVTFIPGKERLYLTTEQQLLASLQTRAGSVAWRRKYSASDPLEKALALQKPAVVIAASRACKHVRAWDASEGGFKWEALGFEGPTTAEDGASCDIAAVDLGGVRGTAVAVASKEKLKLLAASKGDELWSSDLEQAAQGSSKLLLTAGDTVSVVAYTPGSADLYLLSVAAADGSHTDNEHLTAPATLGGVAAVSGSSVAVVSKDGNQLCTLTLDGDGAPAAEVVCHSLQDVAPAVSASSSRHLELAAAGPGSFSVSVRGAPGVAIVSSDGTASWVADAMAVAPAAATAASFSSTDETRNQGTEAGTGSTAARSVLAVVSSSADGDSVTVQLLDAVSWTIVETSTVAVPAAAYPTSGPAPRVVAAWLDAHKYRGPDSSKAGALKGCQLVLLWSDDQLSYVSGRQLLWSREEALAASISNLIIDLPAARQAAAAAGQQGGAAGLLGLLQDQAKLKRWVRLQVLSVLVQFKLSTQQEQEEFLVLRQELSDKNLPFRDSNGFRKLIVLLTSPGKVFALHSGDGRILWASSTPATAASATGKQHLRVWKRYHDLMHAPQLAVISAGAKASALQVLNGHTGETLQEQQLDYGVDKVIPQHQPVHDGAAEQFVFLLVEPLPASSPAAAGLALPKVHLVPHTANTQQHLAKHSSSLFFWLLQQNDTQTPNAGSEDVFASQAQTVLRGYGLEASAVPGSSGLLPVVPAWQVVLPGQLLGLAAKDPSEPVHSYVKILGDRSLKYRYLNPNLLFVATGPSPSASGQVSPDEQSVSVTILNTVTGGVLHTQVHQGCAGPVHAVVSENWIVYVMRNLEALRTQATVIELYDASHHDLSIEGVILGRTKHSAALSSYAAPPLEVLSQTFYLQHSITGLGVTQTKQGITTKQLLIQTISDQVYALDKRFLDPRRPLRAKVTPEEAEERLLPYNELIIFSTLQYPTQDKQVLGLRGVSVAPAVLESTTLVLCYGSDLFFTRISPALHFDSLQSDFSYGLLVMALIALTVGTFVARISSEKAMLKAKWQ